VNDKKLNAMVEFYYERHVEGECLKDLFQEIYIVGKGSAIRAMQNNSLISELQAAQDVLKEMEQKKGGQL